MMGTRDCILIVLSSLVVFEALTPCNADGLKPGFYNTTCPGAELIVRNITGIRVRSNSTLAAKLLRMHFHDCFVRGCDASILLNSVGSTQSEKDAIPNRSLSGFEVIDEIKAKLEQVCPDTVSCADILALSARDAVSLRFKKLLWDVPTGRKDGTVSLASEVNGNIPSPFSNFTTLMQIFTNKGLNVNDLVALSGGHTIGVGHCATFTNRLYNFTGNNDMDPSLNVKYAKILKEKCPNPANSSTPANPATTVDMDPETPLIFDNNYYNVLVQKKGLFQSDAALMKNPESARIVGQLLISNAFFTKFKISMEKMGAIQVLTGNAGQIRKKCNVVNP